MTNAATKKRTGRPRTVYDARTVSVYLSPEHFRILARLMRQEQVKSRAELMRRLIERGDLLLPDTSGS